MKRRVFSIFVALALCLSLVPGTALAADPTGGTSTTITPDTSWYNKNSAATAFTIGSATELAGLATLVNDETDSFDGDTITLTADIDLSDIDWTPIGTSSSPFKGTFDGMNVTTKKKHTISGLRITQAQSGIVCYGLFGYIKKGTGDTGGTVQNLAVSGNFSVTTERDVCVGGIVGACKGTIRNCQFSGRVSSSSTGNTNEAAYVGGVVGCVSVNSSVSNCYNTGTVSGSGIDSRVGGVVGYVSSTSSISNSYNTGTVSLIGDGAVGGVAGYVVDNVSDSYNTGTVSLSGNSRDDTVGGVAGYVGSNVSDCFYLTGMGGTNDKGVGNDKTGTTAIDAAAFTKQDTFTNWSFDGENPSWVMGPFRPLLSWEAAAASPKNPYKIASVYDLETLRDFVNNNTTIDGTTEGAKYSEQKYQLVMDLQLNEEAVPNLQDAQNPPTTWTPIGIKLENAFTGTFDGNGHTISGLAIKEINDVTNYGLFGYVGTGGVVQNLAVRGTVSVEVTGNVSIYVGGVVGHSNGGTIENCHFSGKVNGTVKTSDSSGFSYVGGVAGYVTSSNPITRCSNSGTVTGGVSGLGSGYIGGVVGQVCSESSTVSHCFNTGEVADSSNNNSCVGGVAGYVGNTSEFSVTTIVTSCYNIGTVNSNAANLKIGSVAGHIIASSDDQSAVSITNCYYQTNTQTTSGLLGVGEVKKDDDTITDPTTPATETQFASGEIAWKLQNTQTPQIWGQTLTKDDFPVLTSDAAKRVCLQTFQFGNGTDPQSSYMNPGKITAPTPDPTKDGYPLDGWYNGETKWDFDNDIVTGDLILTARYITPPSSSGGGGSSRPSTPTITVPVSSEQGSVSVKATVKNGNASVEISDKQINQVVAEGAKNVTVDLASLKNVESATLPAHVLETTSNAEDVGLTVALPTGSVSLDNTAMESVSTGEDVTVSVKRVPATDLNEAQQAAVDDIANIGLVFDVDILVGKEKQSDFNGGKLTISVPYTPKKGEDVSKLTVWFIKDDGTIQPMGGYYDAEKKCFVFETTHLSRYVIVSVENVPSFTDVPEDAYYADAVTWAVLNGITTGMTETTFGPDVSCTRAQIVTFLWRAAGEPVVEGSNPFSDVSESDYFYQAVLWAVENKITTGTTETTFSPEDTCTRAQAAAFIYRNEQANGGGFTDNWAFQLPFTDVPAWCYEAVAWCYMNGITQGTSETTFSPDLDCSRAQIVTMLYRENLL